VLHHLCEAGFELRAVVAELASDAYGGRAPGTEGDRMTRAYLTEAMPMAVIWGRDDMVIPVRHASNAAALAPNARVEVIPNAGHFPHKDHPERFVKILNDFVRTTQPAKYSRARWRRLLQRGGDPQVRFAEAGDGPVQPVTALPGA
jgi:alpha-beta hydrolase superfamily lysophospholipase